MLALMPQAGAELPPGGTFVDDDGSVHERFDGEGNDDASAFVAAQNDVGTTVDAAGNSFTRAVDGTCRNPTTPIV